MTGRRDAAPPSRNDRDGGVYVHVPFCAAICSYCHFARTDRHDADLRARWAEGVLAELDLRLAACPSLRGGGRRIASLYVGGGTPSVLEPELLVGVLDGLRARLPLAADAEVTVEANPESLDAARADAWAAAGVDRISLGVQSLRDDTLALLGRASDPATARRALALAASRFPRVSADWILAPGTTADHLAAEFAEARGLGVGHVSFYILEWHEGTELWRAERAGRVRRDPDARTEAVYLEALEALERLGYRQYEVSNACLPGQRSRHNAAYWARRPYLGLGPGAHGFWGRRRYANHGAVGAWLAALDAGEVPEASVDRLDRAARALERVVLGLRTVAGVSLTSLDVAAADLARGRDEGLWTVADGRLRLTPRGFLRIDDVGGWLADRLAPRGGRVDTPFGRGLPCARPQRHPTPGQDRP